MIINKNKPYDVKSNFYSQMFGNETDRHSNTDKAVELTKNIIMTYNNKPVLAYFYAHSGGYTETPENVWINSLPYFKSEPDKFSPDNKYSEWKKTISENKIIELLQKNGYYKIRKIIDIYPVKKSKSGRWTKIGIKHTRGNLILRGNKLRLFLGSQFTLRSLLITKIIKSENNFIFYGKGSGHGVGLPQWSGKNMAEQNYKFRDILLQYYKDIDFAKLEY
jgi:stage II sporulation protein D